MGEEDLLAEEVKLARPYLSLLICFTAGPHLGSGASEPAERHGAAPVGCGAVRGVPCVTTSCTSVQNRTAS